MFYISFEDLDVLGLRLGGPGFRGPRFWALKFMGPSFWASGPVLDYAYPVSTAKLQVKQSSKFFFFVFLQ